MAADRLHDFAQHYVRELREGDSTNAFHSLTEADARIVPLLIAEFARASDTALRTQLLRVIAEFRLPETVPFFAERLFDGFWKTALDALVMQASPAAIAALERGRARTFVSQKQTADFRVRLEEELNKRMRPGVLEGSTLMPFAHPLDFPFYVRTWASAPLSDDERFP